MCSSRALTDSQNTLLAKVINFAPTSSRSDITLVVAMVEDAIMRCVTDAVAADSSRSKVVSLFLPAAIFPLQN